MQLIWCLLSNFYLNTFRASLCPSSGEQDRVLLHMVFCTGCGGCDCVELGRKLCALCESYCLTEASACNTDTTQTQPHHLQPAARTPLKPSRTIFSLQHGHHSNPAAPSSACNTDTTQIQPHQISNTQRTKNKTTNVVIQQHSRKLLMMDTLMCETCWIHKK